MWEWFAPLLSALGVGILALVGNVALSRRQRSGSVQTSEAADLWRESSALRQELHKQVEALNLQIATLRAENSALQAELIEVRRGHQDCEERLTEFKKILARRQGLDDD